jgi:hypothetical protein
VGERDGHVINRSAFAATPAAHVAVRLWSPPHRSTARYRERTALYPR